MCVYICVYVYIYIYIYIYTHMYVYQSKHGAVRPGSEGSVSGLFKQTVTCLIYLGV